MTTQNCRIRKLSHYQSYCLQSGKTELGSRNIDSLVIAHSKYLSETQIEKKELLISFLLVTLFFTYP